MRQRSDLERPAVPGRKRAAFAAALVLAAAAVFLAYEVAPGQDEGGRSASDRPSQKFGGARPKTDERDAPKVAAKLEKPADTGMSAGTAESALKKPAPKAGAAGAGTDENAVGKPAAGGTSETRAKSPKKQPITITGDLFEMEPDDTYVVTGNVVVNEGGRILTCARGTYNEKTGITQALTNVDVVDKKFKMKCQRVDSHMKENFSIFSGGVMIVGENFTAQAEKAHYYEKEEKMILVGNPMARSRDEIPNEVHGERIIYYMKTERSEVIGNVSAILNPKKNDPKGSVTHITGNKLEILEDGTYQVLDNLRVIKKDMILYADRGTYDETGEVTEAYGNVKVENQKYTLTSGYIKNLAREDRTIANIKPKLVQIINKKDRKPKKSEGGKAGDEKKAEETKTAGGEGAAQEDAKNPKDAEGNADKDKEKDKGKEKKKISNRDKVVLEANEIESLDNSTHIIARGKAVLVQYPYLGGEGTEDVEISSTVQSDIMDIFTEEGKMIAKDNVVLTTKDITAYGETATYFENEERLDIEGNARAVQKRGKGLEDNDIVGQKISYFTGTERVLVTGPKIKFYQTKKEDTLPEIEKDTRPVRLRRRKSETTGEVGIAKTGEVGLPKTGEVSLGKSTSEVGLKTPAATGEVKFEAAPPPTAATMTTTATATGARTKTPPRAPAPDPKVKIMISPAGKVKVNSR